MYKTLILGLGLLVGTLILASRVSAGPEALPPPTVLTPLARILENKLSWRTDGPLALPSIQEEGALPIAYKDPTVVQFNGRSYIIASRPRSINKKTLYSLAYFRVTDWQQPEKARVVPLLSEHDASAPSLFYFSPHKKWYIIYGYSDPVTKYRGPAFSTLDDLDQPETITAPQPCFPALPATLPKKEGVKWLDFSFIGDGQKMYMFFTNDGGQFMRCSTSYADFPRGWSDPVVLLSEDKSVIFEASQTYKLKDSPYYLTIIEAFAKNQNRYFTSFIADRLDGAWRQISGTEAAPFAGATNVQAAPGTAPWSPHISHGELICASYDERMLLDPAQLTFLYQGWDKVSRLPEVPQGRFGGYHEIPWRLSLMRAVQP